MVITAPIDLNVSADLPELRHTPFERATEGFAVTAGEDVIYIL